MLLQFNLLILLMFSPVLGGGTSLTVNRPTPDAVVTGAAVTISGTSAATSVTLQSGTALSSVAVIDNRWSFAAVPIAPGLNTLTISDGNEPLTVFITRGTGIAARPQQKVRFVWEEGSDDVLRGIASGTLDRQLDDLSLDRFVRDVKTLTAEVFSRAYDGIADIRLVPDDADDVHTVRFLAIDEDVFGLTLTDCGNADLHGHTRVFVGTYRRLLVGHLDQWPPMAAGDEMDVRIRDMAEALGRTAAHEVGHGVGLVVDDGQSPCNWMNGCSLNHSCATFQSLHPGIRRFANGGFIMDAGDETMNHARLAEPGEDGRAQRRRPSVFCDFDRSYLGVIHPLPTGGVQ